MYAMSFITYNDDAELLGLKLPLSFIIVHLKVNINDSLRISVKVVIKQNFWITVS